MSGLRVCCLAALLGACAQKPVLDDVGRTSQALCVGTPCVGGSGGTCGSGLQCVNGCCTSRCTPCGSCAANEVCDATNGECCVPDFHQNQQCSLPDSPCGSAEPCGQPTGSMMQGYCARNCFGSGADQNDQCCFNTGCANPDRSYQACAFNAVTMHYECTGPLFCEPYFADCNNDPSDGCETAVDANTACGDCPSNPMADCNAAARHVSGGFCQYKGPGVAGCNYSSCAANFSDCDGERTNGCEVDLHTVANCGGCGNNCAAGGTPANGTWSCPSGSCVLSCSGGKTPCNNNSCIDTTSDVDNCGSCGNGCDITHSTGRTCTTSKCHYTGCNTPYSDCDTSGADLDGCETNLNTDPAHCGACTSAVCTFANSQTLGRACIAGTCTGTCQASFLDCDPGTAHDINGCETPYSTTNCGGCGTACSNSHGTAACIGAGTCLITCDTTHGNCDGNANNGCEATSDTAHCGGVSCGACDTVKSTPTTCNSNVCQYTCKPGFADCNTTAPNLNGCETAEDATHCTAACVSCTTPPHTTGAACKSDACSYAACAAGYTDCNTTIGDGCEIHTDVDKQNCGTCGHVCPEPLRGAPACVGGTCTATCETDGSIGLKVCFAADGTPSCNECCGDSDCTALPDKCHVGSCVAGFCQYPGKTCVVVDCYTQPSCNLANGNCESNPLTGGTCGGNGCFANGATGTCASGQCVDGMGNPLQQITCPGAGPCKLGVCDHTGTCSVSDAPNASACTPDDKCQENATCTGGTCSGTAKVCTTTAACRTSACNSATGACDESLAPAGQSCASGVACVQNEACDATGACIGNPSPDGTPCVLADCTSGAACASGTCACDATPVDAAMPVDATPVKPKGNDKNGGCAAAGSDGAAGLIGWLCAALLLSRRSRRRSSPGT